MPRDEPTSLTSRRRSSHCHSRPASLDRVKKTNNPHWRADRARSASVGGETLIPDTEPEEVDELWNYIRKEKVLTMSSEQSKLPVRRARDRLVNKKKGQQVEGSTPSETLSTKESTNTEDSTTVITTASSAKLKKASPYDSDFREQVLDPRGIFIVEEYFRPAQDHFGTHAPGIDEDIREFYRQNGSKESTVWLNISESFVEEVVQEYSCMEEQRMVEAEFALYAWETLFRRDSRLSPRQFGDSRAWKTDRRVTLVAKPDTARWAAPPILPGFQSSKQYDFDIRPDCAYWLSLQAFNPEYVAGISQWTHVIKHQITCPYFFIEFKKDDKDSQCAENQIAAAASMALHNRFNLRIRRMEKSQKPFHTLNVSNLRVYAITFRASEYTVWCVKPKFDTDTFRWAGCDMTRIWEGTCTVAVGVRTLANWINEIHRWGLSVHGPNCENDVKICIGAIVGGPRTSAYNEDMQ